METLGLQHGREKGMELKALFPLLMLVMVSGCRAGEAQTPEDTGEMPYGKVGFAFFTPQALPAVVTKALIIDNEKVVSTYRTLDSTQENPESVGRWSSRVSRHAQFNKVRHPPAQMLLCWDSVIDKKTYETRITFPDGYDPDIKDFIKGKKYPYGSW